MVDNRELPRTLSGITSILSNLYLHQLSYKLLQILSAKNMAAEVHPHNSNAMLPCTQSCNCVTELSLRCGVEWRRRQPITDSQIWQIIEIKFLPGDFQYISPETHDM